MVLVVLAILSGTSFIYYGSAILFRPRMRDEFARYGMSTFRVLVGTAELLGGAGVLLGLAYAPVGAAAAAGLALLMALGVLTRVRIHDGPRLMVPAALLVAVNIALVVFFLNS